MPSDSALEQANFLLETALSFLQRGLLTPEIFAALSAQVSFTLQSAPQEMPRSLPVPGDNSGSEKLTDTVKNLIRTSGLSLHEIGRMTDIDPSQLSRFLRGQRDLSLSSAEKLCAALQMRFYAPAPNMPLPNIHAIPRE